MVVRSCADGESYVRRRLYGSFVTEDQAETVRVNAGFD